MLTTTGEKHFLGTHKGYWIIANFICRFSALLNFTNFVFKLCPVYLIRDDNDNFLLDFFFCLGVHTWVYFNITAVATHILQIFALNLKLFWLLLFLTIWFLSIVNILKLVVVWVLCFLLFRHFRLFHAFRLWERFEHGFILISFSQVCFDSLVHEGLFLLAFGVWLPSFRTWLLLRLFFVWDNDWWVHVTWARWHTIHIYFLCFFIL